jgi:hypothetical protein
MKKSPKRGGFEEPGNPLDWVPFFPDAKFIGRPDSKTPDGGLSSSSACKAPVLLAQCQSEKRFEAKMKMAAAIATVICDAGSAIAGSADQNMFAVVSPLPRRNLDQTSSQS